MHLAILSTNIGGEFQRSVNLREIHEKVLSGQDFSTWAKSRLEACNAVEERDFTVHKFVASGSRGQVTIDYHVTMDIAKHCAMLERNEQGFAIRQYLIDVEKGCRSPFPSDAKWLDLIVRGCTEAIDRNQKIQLIVDNTKKRLQPKGCVKEAHYRIAWMLENKRSVYCPIYRDILIGDEQGSHTDDCHIDHFFTNEHPDFQHTWPISKKANLSGFNRPQWTSTFKSYQDRAARLIAELGFTLDDVNSGAFLKQPQPKLILKTGTALTQILSRADHIVMIMGDMPGHRGHTNDIAAEYSKRGLFKGAGNPAPGIRNGIQRHCAENAEHRKDGFSDLPVFFISLGGSVYQLSEDGERRLEFLRGLNAA